MRIIVPVVVLYLIVAFYYTDHVPDLPVTKPADLVTHTPEFNGQARLVRIEEVYHLQGSLNGMSDGHFTFQPSNARVGTTPIKAQADFRYWDGAWHLNRFDYGCPADCHIVNVYNKPPRSHPHPLVDVLLFRQR